MKYLLPPVQFYKASLHTHSTVSDGKLTPQEVKDLYKAKGYSILALTDHHVIAAHPELNDPDFLALTSIEIGMETEDYAPPQSFFGKAYHFNLIAKDPDNLWQPYPPKKVTDTNREYVEKAHWDQRQRIYSVEMAQEIIKRANEEGFLVTYNHPVWSNQYYPDYITLEGIWALEIRNTHNCMIGINENNALAYRDFLHEGRRMCVVAADDTHRTHTIGGSFTMIGAKELTYASVIEAMEKGDVYASCGPLIHSLSLDGTSLRITCDTAAEILLETQTRHAQRATGGITEAEFDLSVWMEKSKGDSNAYIRLTVIAPDGSYAATRAYFMDELGV